MGLGEVEVTGRDSAGCLPTDRSGHNLQRVPPASQDPQPLRKLHCCGHEESSGRPHQQRADKGRGRLRRRRRTMPGMEHVTCVLSAKCRHEAIFFLTRKKEKSAEIEWHPHLQQSGFKANHDLPTTAMDSNREEACPSCGTRQQRAPPETMLDSHSEDLYGFWRTNNRKKVCAYQRPPPSAAKTTNLAREPH